VVVHCRTRRQLRTGPCRSLERECHAAGVGLRCRSSDGHYHCSVREFEPSRLLRTVSRTNIVQSTLLYARFGNGIATNNLSKVIAGLLLPGRPIGNMYFAAWSHNVINGTVQLSMDLKLGEYRTSLPHIHVLKLNQSSQGSTSCHVFDAGLWHRFRRLYQLRCNDLHRDK
jgi:hypothetical protein